MQSATMFGIALFASTVVTSTAIAKPLVDIRPSAFDAKVTAVADSVVVNPGGATSAPAPAVAQPQVVEGAPRHTTILHEEQHNYMSTIAVNTFMGGLAGVLIGGAIYYLGNRDHGYRIGYWAAGGVLVGAAVGVTQVLVQESRAEAAVAATRPPEDPIPTFRMALFQRRF